MATREQIYKVVFAAIDEINQQLPSGGRIAKSPEAGLFGPSGVLDSLGLVNLMVAVEQSVQDELGVSVTLADTEALSGRSSPFESVETLVDHLQALVAGSSSG